jgi:hypothetical protein
MMFDDDDGGVSLRTPTSLSKRRKLEGALGRKGAEGDGAWGSCPSVFRGKEAAAGRRGRKLPPVRPRSPASARPTILGLAAAPGPACARLPRTHRLLFLFLLYDNIIESFLCGGRENLAQNLSQGIEEWQKASCSPGFLPYHFTLRSMCVCERERQTDACSRSGFADDGVMFRESRAFTQTTCKISHGLKPRHGISFSLVFFWRDWKGGSHMHSDTDNK